MASQSINLTQLADNTVLLKVSFGLFGNIRKVPTSQVEVDANKSYINVSKKLLESKELDAVKRADGEMRRWLYDMCLQSPDAGILFCPVAAIERIQEKLLEYSEERQDLVDAFLSAYSELRENAQIALRSLFNPMNYPPLKTVENEFTFHWRYITFGVPGQLAEINSQLFEEEKEKAARQMQDAATEIQQLMRATLAEMVNHLRDRLTDENGKPKRLHETAVTKMREFFETFSFRNVTDDRELAEQVSKAKELLTGVSIEALRTTDSLRANLRDSLAEVSAQLDTMISDKPSRKFRDDIAA